MSHINDLFFDPGLAGLVAIGKLENTATTLAAESFTLSRAEPMSVNFIRITAGTMDSYGSHDNTSNNGRISQIQPFRGITGKMISGGQAS